MRPMVFPSILLSDKSLVFVNPGKEMKICIRTTHGHLQHGMRHHKPVKASARIVVRNSVYVPQNISRCSHPPAQRQNREGANRFRPLTFSLLMGLLDLTGNKIHVPSTIAILKHVEHYAGVLTKQIN